jgi:hypothetical protein
LADIAAGRVKAFDARDILERGGDAIRRALALRLTEAAETDLIYSAAIDILLL